MKKSKLLLALFSGLLLSASWPTYGFPYLLFFAFIPLFFLEKELKNKPKAILKLWAYSFLALIIWNAATTWWIWNSTVFGALTAVVLNSLFMSFVWLIYAFSKKYYSANKNAIFLLPLYWVSFEYLHLDWDLSWSWLTLGNAFANHIYAVQWYEYTGVFGGGWWIISVNILLYRYLDKIQSSPKIARKYFLWLWPSLSLIMLPLVFSVFLYSTYEEKGKEVEIVVLQPNMDPWSEQFLSPPQEVINRCIALAKPLMTENTKFVLAPESAIQESLLEPDFTYAASSGGQSVSIPLLNGFLGAYPNTRLMIGVSSYAFLEKPTKTARTTNGGSYYDEYNTAILLDHQGVETVYHKNKLVPGPEKMPFQKLLSPLQELAFDLGGTVGSLGSSEDRPLFYSTDKSIAGAPLICYESIYGGFVTEFVRQGAQVLFIITNDGWWGETQGYKQHLAYARLRAVECRRSVARSANTGVSAFVNQKGNIISQSSYGVQDALVASIRANTEYTFYAKYGDYLGRLSAFVSVLLLLLSVAIWLKTPKSNSPT
ncbi:MAG: apolipoprotein N-acyltransferase [Bacteroidetes bacterium 4572_77]|nr:MAG: apolipoprotein N-acyltransferase [Bacteroidetes bacterium 4572_77]